MTATRNTISQYNEEVNYLTVLVSKSNSLRLIFCGHIKNKLCLTTSSNVEKCIERISNAVGKPDLAGNSTALTSEQTQREHTFESP